MVPVTTMVASKMEQNMKEKTQPNNQGQEELFHESKNLFEYLITVLNGKSKKLLCYSYVTSYIVFILSVTNITEQLK